jgi:hypothetical protein
MFCAPPVEAACGNARCRRERSLCVPQAGSANGMAIAPCVRSPAHVRRHRRAAAIEEPQSRKGIAEPRRAAVLALPRPPALRFLNRANKWCRRNALAHVNR